MSTAIVNTNLARVSRFYESTIGKKAVMAATGFILLHLTTGTIHPHFVELDAYDNLITGFRVIPAAIAYVIAMVLIGMHLRHGIWSMFQSFGFSHPRYTPMIKKFAAVFSWILVAGFVSVPAAVLTGLVRGPV